MNASSLFATPLFAALLIATSLGARAQTQAPAPVAVAASEPMATGEVRKVDMEAGKVTLRHGPIASLGMPAMTMVFRVADPKMLDQLKQGDKIRFSADRLNGAIVLTEVELEH